MSTSSRSSIYFLSHWTKIWSHSMQIQILTTVRPLGLHHRTLCIWGLLHESSHPLQDVQILENQWRVKIYRRVQICHVVTASLPWCCRSRLWRVRSAPRRWRVGEQTCTRCLAACTYFSGTLYTPPAAASASLYRSTDCSCSPLPCSTRAGATSGGWGEEGVCDTQRRETVWRCDGDDTSVMGGRELRYWRDEVFLNCTPMETVSSLGENV